MYNASGNGCCLYDTSTHTWTKRLWVMGNFSRFVRPGYTRVSTAGTVPSGVLLAAYENPADGTVVMVSINNNTSATPVPWFVSGAAPCTVTPWVTGTPAGLKLTSSTTMLSAVDGTQDAWLLVTVVDASAKPVSNNVVVTLTIKSGPPRRPSRHRIPHVLRRHLRHRGDCSWIDELDRHDHLRRFARVGRGDHTEGRAAPSLDLSLELRFF